MLRECPGRFPGDAVAVSVLHLPVHLADAMSDPGRRIDPGALTEYGLPVPEEGIFARMDRIGAASQARRARRLVVRAACV